MVHIKDLRQRKAGYTGERPYLARYGHLWPDSEDCTRSAVAAVFGTLEP